MCGISGIVGNNWRRDNLEAMVKVQHHRGPDFSATYISDDEKVGLGHNRLSILDLSAAGNQPMFSDDKRYIIVFNGEIYNFIELREQLQKEFKFNSSSDTEVLVKAWEKWGKDCLEYLNGMFAFAIWDTVNESLFAARDRFGVKPLYYSFSNNNFYFASEIKTLWAAGVKKKSYEPIWSSYLSKGTYSSGGMTFWTDISELPGGHFLEYKQEEIKIAQWYHFQQNVSRTTVYQDEKALEEHYTSLLIDAVALRFRSDVPVGFNISGGLDSSILLAMVNYLFPRENDIKAYSFYTGDERYDELPWVHSMLSNTSNPLTACLLTPEDVFERTANMCYMQDEPFGGIPTLAYSRVFEEATKDVVVLLDGQGMDEAWAGYDYYLNNVGFTVQGSTTSPVRPNTLSKSFIECAAYLNGFAHFDDKVKNLQYRDLFHTKIPRALRFNDRVSMMYSTELREPFLDYRLVELAFAQDTHMKIRNNVRKWMLRNIASRYLNADITQSPKRALQTPQREWLAGVLKPMVDKSVAVLCDHNWFNADELKKEWQSYLSGSGDNSFFVWQWINTSELLTDN